MATTRSKRVLGAAVFCAAVFVTGVLSAFAEEQLVDGGFELGSDGWIVAGAQPASCGPRTGAGALGIAVAAGQRSLVRKAIPGPFAPGEFTFSGWVNVGAGAAEGTMRIELEPVAPEEPLAREVGVPVTGAYEHASVSLVADQNIAAIGLTFDVTAQDGGATVCFDDLSASAPDAEPPTATLEPTPTSTTSVSPSPAPGGGSGGTPLPSATSSPVPSVTPQPTAGPGFVFVNGGFEQELYAWSKHGGTLDTTRANALSGERAGVLTSTSDSTKWAYQTVAIDPAQHYQFAGFVRADSGVREAYLRISWYASPNGSGEAIATSDSLTVATSGGGFEFLSTGPVLPPSGAASARPRVLLTPHGAGEATVYMDDMLFAQAPPPVPTATATLTVTAQPSPTGISEVQSIAPQRSATTPEAAQATATGTSERSRVAEASSSGIVTPTSSPRPAGTPAAATSPTSEDSLGGENDDGSGFPVPWVIGGALFAFGLAGAYIQGRRVRE